MCQSQNYVFYLTVNMEIGQGRGKESEREIKQRYHHVESCNIHLVLFHPGLLGGGGP